ncbi:MAG: glycosyltransferase, partial [Gemmatimonadaceae bacterium]
MLLPVSRMDVLPWITGPVSGPVLFGVYAASVAIVTAYAVGQYHLLWRYWRTPARPVPPVPSLTDRAWPSVTVQIPLYNERYVAAEIIDACAALEYPPDRLELQVLDDSTDDTREIVDARAAHWRARGITVTVFRRPTREGYKAGALAAATPQATGDFLALFDADFRPAPDFLRRCVPEFDAVDVGAVQARWGHLNRGYSILTLAQSLLHDAFFFVEQEARARSGYFTRFNGS